MTLCSYKKAAAAMAAPAKPAKAVTRPASAAEVEEAPPDPPDPPDVDAEPPAPVEPVAPVDAALAAEEALLAADEAADWRLDTREPRMLEAGYGSLVSVEFVLCIIETYHASTNKSRNGATSRVCEGGQNTASSSSVRGIDARGSGAGRGSEGGRLTLQSVRS